MVTYSITNLNELADMFQQQAVDARNSANRQRTKGAAAIDTARANTLFHVASVIRDTTMVRA